MKKENQNHKLDKNTLFPIREEKEFNLSEKEKQPFSIDDIWDIYFTKEDVKEFIRLNDEDLQKVNNGEISIEEATERIRERAGDKLI